MTALWRRLSTRSSSTHSVGSMLSLDWLQPVLGQVEAIKDASLTDMCDDHENPTGTVDANLFGESSHQLSLDDAVAKVIAAANEAGARTLAELDEHGSPVAGTIWDPGGRRSRNCVTHSCRSRRSPLVFSKPTSRGLRPSPSRQLQSGHVGSRGSGPSRSPMSDSSHGDLRFSTCFSDGCSSIPPRPRWLLPF